MGSDPELLWLRCRPAAVAPILPLGWEVPYAAGAVLEREEAKNGKEEGREGRWMDGKKKGRMESRKEGCADPLVSKYSPMFLE